MFLFSDGLSLMISRLSLISNELFINFCNDSNYGESIRHLDVRSGEHIGVSPLTGKKVIQHMQHMFVHITSR